MRRKTRRFIVEEIRARRVQYLVEAVDADAAGRLDGTLLEEGGDHDDYGLELVSVRETEATELP